MKHLLRIGMGFVAATWLLTGLAAEQASPVGEFQALEGRIKAKVRKGASSEKDLAPELKAFDELTSKYKSLKTEEVAGLFLEKANLYLQVLDDTSKGREIINQVIADFPGTEAANDALLMLEGVGKQESAKRIQATLTPGTVFPDVVSTDLTGKSVKLSDYRGKVLLVHFWGSWSGTSRSEIESLLKVYSAWQPKGLEILGVNLDKESRMVVDYLNQKGVRWPQIWEGQGWETKLALRTGVHRLPATYLLDRQGKILGANLQGADLEAAIKKAVEAKPSA